VPENKSICYRRTTCRLCDSDQITPILTLAPTPPANAFVATEALEHEQERFPLELWFCEACAHVQILDIVDPAVLFRDYVYVSGTSPVFIKHFEEYAKTLISDYALDPGALAVDIGSNDGTLLGFFKAGGLDVLGIDPAVDIAAGATASGIETWPEFFDTGLARRIRNERGPAAVVTANNVFAHADDLGGIADGIHDLLDDQGIFAFEVSYLLDVYEKTLFDTIYHEHLSYHSVKPLVDFFSAHGMRLIRAERIGTHGGSLRGIACRKEADHALDDSVATLIKREADLGLHDTDTFQAFGQHISALRDELGALLRGLKSAGKTIAGYGAPAKATTLMYHFDLGPGIIDFIVDDSPLKQGLYSPGMHIPVLPSSALAERKPDYLLILAWNFAEPIMRNNAAFIEAGGHFIVPIPKVEVLPL